MKEIGFGEDEEVGGAREGKGRAGVGDVVEEEDVVGGFEGAQGVGLHLPVNVGVR